jgi:hypothetical protein
MAIGTPIEGVFSPASFSASVQIKCPIYNYHILLLTVVRVWLVIFCHFDLVNCRGWPPVLVRLFHSSIRVTSTTTSASFSPSSARA